jgi:uncharacterized protein HemY
MKQKKADTNFFLVMLLIALIFMVIIFFVINNVFEIWGKSTGKVKDTYIEKQAKEAGIDLGETSETADTNGESSSGGS